MGVLLNNRACILVDVVVVGNNVVIGVGCDEEAQELVLRGWLLKDRRAWMTGREKEDEAREAALRRDRVVCGLHDSQAMTELELRGGRRAIGGGAEGGCSGGAVAEDLVVKRR